MRVESIQKTAFGIISQTAIHYRESPLSESADRLPSGAPQAGDRFPWLKVKLAPTGAVEDLFEALDDARFNLLVIGQPAPPADALEAAACCASTRSRRFRQPGGACARGDRGAVLLPAATRRPRRTLRHSCRCRDDHAIPGGAPGPPRSRPHMIEDEDTGSALRSLYEPQGGVRAIFASKVADYIASRPDYPDALFDALAQNCGLRDGATIADIGAGTGLLTQGC
jgi:hypothetical protein